MSDEEYETEECLACSGTGMDRCHECGHEIECPVCDGTGSVEVES